MERQRDPVEESADGRRDLYDIATWERRTLLDRLATTVYDVLSARVLVVLVALVILLSQFALTGLAFATEPLLAVFTALSVVPALGLAVYIWHADVTMNEPLSLMVVTFLFGVLFAGFAAILNTLAQPLFNVIPAVGMAVFFFVVVAPVEEAVKLLAVRVYAYQDDAFDAVIDGAVYGAIAGLGFATIENALYITRGLTTGVGANALDNVIQTAALRLFAGPGHVIYSAFAGYYLGLAKFNPEDAGPIVVKGLLVAGGIHATYNTAVTYMPVFVRPTGIPFGVAFIGFVVAYDGVFGYLLYRKIARYRAAYTDAQTSKEIAFDSGPAHEPSREDESPTAGEADAESVTDDTDTDTVGEWPSDSDG